MTKKVKSKSKATKPIKEIDLPIPVPDELKRQKKVDDFNKSKDKDNYKNKMKFISLLDNNTTNEDNFYKSKSSSNYTNKRNSLTDITLPPGDPDKIIPDLGNNTIEDPNKIIPQLDAPTDGGFLKGDDKNTNSDLDPVDPKTSPVVKDIIL
jgi:hypothetical protein